MKKTAFLVSFICLIINVNAQHFRIEVTNKYVFLYDSIKNQKLDSLKRSVLPPSVQYDLDSTTVVSLTSLGSLTSPPSPNVQFEFFDVSKGKFTQLHRIPLSIENQKNIGMFKFSLEKGNIVLYKRDGVVSEFKIRIKRRIKQSEFQSILNKVGEL